jgi:hypothetical protein
MYEADSKQCSFEFFLAAAAQTATPDYLKTIDWSGYRASCIVLAG